MWHLWHLFFQPQHFASLFKKVVFGTNFFRLRMEVFGRWLFHCWTAVLCQSLLVSPVWSKPNLKNPDPDPYMQVCPISTSSLNKFWKHCFYLRIKVHYVYWAAGMIARPIVTEEHSQNGSESNFLKLLYYLVHISAKLEAISYLWLWWFQLQ